MEFTNDGRIKVDPPKRPKKLTATRFATIMGLNAWSTPFSAWCEMTRTYEEPFEDSIYTIAGKVIEPKICEYLRNRYFMDIKSPTDVYGADYFKKTWGDFFPNVEALGGMWDFLGDDFVVEVKTTKRAEDWKGKDGNPEPPIYYKLQAALYAYLLGFDDVVMTCSFLEAKDYEDPEAFKPNVNNTVVIEFKVSEAFPTFKETYVEPALKFWNEYVLTGLSPQFDEKKDADILKALRKNTLETTDDEITKLLKEGDRLKAQIDKAKDKIADKEKRLKEIDDQVKIYLKGKFGKDDKQVEIKGTAYTWTLTKSERKAFDTDGLKKESPELFSKYDKAKISTTYTLNRKLIETSES